MAGGTVTVTGAAPQPPQVPQANTAAPQQVQTAAPGQKTITVTKNPQGQTVISGASPAASVPSQTRMSGGPITVQASGPGIQEKHPHMPPPAAVANHLGHEVHHMEHRGRRDVRRMKHCLPCCGAVIPLILFILGAWWAAHLFGKLMHRHGDLFPIDRDFNATMPLTTRYNFIQHPISSREYVETEIKTKTDMLEHTYTHSKVTNTYTKTISGVTTTYVSTHSEATATTTEASASSTISIYTVSKPAWTTTKYSHKTAFNHYLVSIETKKPEPTEKAEKHNKRDIEPAAPAKLQKELKYHLIPQAMWALGPVYDKKGWRVFKNGKPYSAYQPVPFKKGEKPMLNDDDYHMNAIFTAGHKRQLSPFLIVAIVACGLLALFFFLSVLYFGYKLVNRNRGGYAVHHPSHGHHQPMQHHEPEHHHQMPHVTMGHHHKHHHGKQQNTQPGLNIQLQRYQRAAKQPEQKQEPVKIGSSTSTSTTSLSSMLTEPDTHPPAKTAAQPAPAPAPAQATITPSGTNTSTRAPTRQPTRQLTPPQAPAPPPQPQQVEVVMPAPQRVPTEPPAAPAPPSRVPTAPAPPPMPEAPASAPAAPSRTATQAQQPANAKWDAVSFDDL